MDYKRNGDWERLEVKTIFLSLFFRSCGGSRTGMKGEGAHGELRRRWVSDSPSSARC